MKPKPPPFTDEQAIILEQLHEKFATKIRELETEVLGLQILLKERGLLDTIEELDAAQEKGLEVLTRIDAEMLLEAALGVDEEGA